MYLIDTDVLIWVIRGRQDVVEKLSLLKKKSSLCISTISIAEIYKNVFPAEFSSTGDFLSRFIIFPIGTTVAKQGGLYWQQYIKYLQKMHLNDCLIAATAREYDLTVVTLNMRHFPMKDIRVLDPLKKK